MAGWRLAINIASCVLALTSCATQKGDIAVIRPKQPKVPSVETGSLFGLGTGQGVEFEHLKTVDKALVGLSEYALLASMGYHEDHSEVDRQCDEVGTPGGVKVVPSNWRRDTNYTNKLIPPPAGSRRWDIPGLGYSVWVEEPSRRRVAVVFRGTDFTEWGDWYSNLRWLTRLNIFTRDQYHQVRDLVPELNRSIEATYGRNVEVIAIGHSLGGGLAQQAAYTMSWIKTVYAFNTTPVTGATSESSKKEYRKGVTIFRPYESGESLRGLAMSRGSW